MIDRSRHESEDFLNPTIHQFLGQKAEDLDDVVDRSQLYLETEEAIALARTKQITISSAAQKIKAVFPEEWDGIKPVALANLIRFEIARRTEDEGIGLQFGKIEVVASNIGAPGFSTIEDLSAYRNSLNLSGNRTEKELAAVFLVRGMAANAWKYEELSAEEQGVLEILRGSKGSEVLEDTKFNPVAIASAAIGSKLGN